MLSKAAARAFFLLGTIGFSAVFLFLTIDTIRRVPAQTKQQNLTEQVVHGKQVSMTGAFAVAGVTQVYLERRVGMDFLAVQNELAICFFGLILAAGLFTLGILAFVYTFVKLGLPIGEVDVLAAAEAA